MRRKREDSAPVHANDNSSNQRVTRQSKQTNQQQQQQKHVRIVNIDNDSDNENDNLQEHALIIPADTASKLHDWYLNGQSEALLLKYRKVDLVEMCMSRGIEIDGSKQELVFSLLHWRKYALPPELQSSFTDDSAKISLPDLARLNIKSSTSLNDIAGMGDLDNAGLSPVDNSADSIEQLSTILPDPVQSDSNSHAIDLSEIRIDKKVGSGAYKTVHRAVYKKCLVALSIINTEKLSKEDLNDIQNEVELLRQLRHDNIVRFIGIVQDGECKEEICDKIYIMTEFCPFGDLSDYMKSKTRSKPSWSRILSILHEITFGVSYLHERRPAIIHRDLKSLNILVDANERMKIADFGLSKTRSKLKARMHTVVGTINWQAPEMWLDNPQYTEKVDVYSCGLIFWEVLNWSDRYPFGELSDAQIYEKVGKQGLRPSKSNLRRYPKEIIEIMEQMWDADPEKRPDMNAVLNRLSTMMN